MDNVSGGRATEMWSISGEKELRGGDPPSPSGSQDSCSTACRLPDWTSFGLLGLGFVTPRFSCVMSLLIVSA